LVLEGYLSFKIDNSKWGRKMIVMNTAAGRYGVHDMDVKFGKK
jgi:hypothetical protein